MTSWITLDGACVGGGLEHALACDLRLAARAAQFGQPEVRLGVVPGWGGMAKIKECVERGLGQPLDEGLAEEARCYVDAYLTEDAREGIRAFLDKRPARFRGR